jgi:phage shock protein A
MGLLERLSTLIRSNVNAIIDAMSDPAREVDELVREMEDGLRKARAEVQAAMATEKLQRRRIDDLLRQSKDWGERAERALNAGDEALAKEALARKSTVDEEGREAVRGLEENAHYIDELTKALRALEAKVVEVKAKKETLKIHARAQAGRGPFTGGAFAEYDRVTNKVDVAEAEVALEEELAAVRHEDAKSREVERRLKELEGNRDIEDRLAALKKKLDKK